MTALASILIPTLNESAAIGGCIEALGEQDLGCSALEVIVADGCSEDDTVRVAIEAGATHDFARFQVVNNPDRRTSAGLHRALAAATSDYVVRIDARSRVGPAHVRRAVSILAEHTDVGVVGGAQVPIDRAEGIVSAGIARSLSNRYTTGLSRYRRSNRSGPTDTVWMGAFRTADLRAIGGWDPKHGINEDYELNVRMREAGHLVWFDRDLAAGYLPRTDLALLGRQYFAFGRAKGEQWGDGIRPAPRQLVLLAAPPLATVGLLIACRLLGPPRALLVGAATALAVDHLGTRPTPAPPAVRLAALAATATFQGAWWAGAMRGWVDRAPGDAIALPRQEGALLARAAGAGCTPTPRDSDCGD